MPILSEATASAIQQGEVLFRPLERGDYYRGYFDLLAQLTVAPPTTEAVFAQFVESSASRGSLTLVAVLDDCIVASATLLVEPKLIRGGSSVAHIEDVVVDKRCGGRGLGQSMVERLCAEATKRGCYKVILDTSEETAGFYAKKCGFYKKEIQMRRDLVVPQGKLTESFVGQVTQKL